VKRQRDGARCAGGWPATLAGAAALAGFAGAVGRTSRREASFHDAFRARTQLATVSAAARTFVDRSCMD